MNDKIKELIEQATEPPVFPANIGYFNQEKFAELIISECIDAVRQQENVNHAVTTYDKDIVGATVERCVRSIKDKFK